MEESKPRFSVILSKAEVARRAERGRRTRGVAAAPSGEATPTWLCDGILPDLPRGNSCAAHILPGVVSQASALRLRAKAALRSE